MLSLAMLRTEILFVSLLKELRVDGICDVGSMDGKHSRLFQAACPQAHIMAFEANPYNYRRMCANPALDAINKYHLAVSDFDGIAPFFIVDADNGPKQGMSSLLPGAHIEQIDVRVVTLDTAISNYAHDVTRLALWIDVEGAGWEVLNGCAGRALTHAVLLHVEVEREPLRTGQHLYPDVIERVSQLGFDPLVTNWRGSQGDILAVRRDILSRQKWTIAKAIARARVVSSLRLQPLLHTILPRGVYDAAKKIYARHLA